MNNHQKQKLHRTLYDVIVKWHEDQTSEGNTPNLHSGFELEEAMASAAMAVYEGIVDNQAELSENCGLEI